MTGASSPRLRVLALAPYPEQAPSTRVRVGQFLGPLEGRGVLVELHPFLDGSGYAGVRQGPLRSLPTLLAALLRLLRRLDTACGYDVVFIQRGMSLLFDGALVRRLQGLGVPLVYDFDDAVFLRQEGGRAWVEGLRDPEGSAAALVRAARVVLAGNVYLAAFARRVLGVGGEARVRVLPSVVDTCVLRPRQGAAPDPVPTLGWIGSDSTLPYLETLAPALRALAARVPHRLVVSAGSRRPRLDGVPFHFVPWSARGESSVLASFDVGLYPLDDTPWSRGKCGFKAIQYMACGVPCVASPVGVLRELVRPGDTGLHARDGDEWVEACARLLSDEGERRRMGRAGRALVEGSYSVQAATPMLASALRDAAGCADAPSPTGGV